MNGSTPLLTVRLQAIRYAARDTWLFECCRPDGLALPAASAGSHIDVHLPGGLVRQYSLVEADEAAAGMGSYLIGVKKDPTSRGGSRAMHEQLHVGQTLPISAPRNNFPLADGPAPSVLVAGGIGITPIWCMVQTLQRAGRPWALYYACRSREDAAFLRELQALGRMGDKVQLHFDEEAGGVMDIAAAVRAAPANAHLYCCGPTPMLAAFEAAAAGRPAGQVHVEYFTAAEAAATGGGYVVQLARSGLELPVAAGQTILAVLRLAGLDVATSCEQGVCGACETAVLEGVVDHRDMILTPDERADNNTMMVCCSGSKSARLVLDI